MEDYGQVIINITQGIHKFRERERERVEERRKEVYSCACLCPKVTEEAHTGMFVGQCLSLQDEDLLVSFL